MAPRKMRLANRKIMAAAHLLSPSEADFILAVMATPKRSRRTLRCRTPPSPARERIAGRPIARDENEATWDTFPGPPSDPACIGFLALAGAARPPRLVETVEVPPAFQPGRIKKRPATRQRRLRRPTPARAVTTARLIVIGMHGQQPIRHQMPRLKLPDFRESLEHRPPPRPLCAAGR